MSRGPERRKSSRHALSVPVDYSSVDDFFTEMATNINEGGIFIATDQPGQLDDLVKLAFRLPGLAEPLEVEGRIAWIGSDASGQHGMGVEFQELSREARERINALVRRLRSAE